MGTHGTGKVNPHGDLTVNESHQHAQVSNARGTMSVAHFDVPDCGGTEIFINLNDNSHLDAAYGGYAVFAKVKDDASFQVVDAIAAAVKEKGRVGILEAVVQ